MDDVLDASLAESEGEEPDRKAPLLGGTSSRIVGGKGNTRVNGSFASTPPSGSKAATASSSAASAAAASFLLPREVKAREKALPTLERAVRGRSALRCSCCREDELGSYEPESEAPSSETGAESPPTEGEVIVDGERRFDS